MKSLSLNKESILHSRTFWFYLGLFFLLPYLHPLFLKNLYIEVFDNLDSTVVWMKILVESGMAFSDTNATVPNMMNGLPRFSYGSELSVLYWLYHIFAPETAYRINEFLIHSLAYVSMWVLITDDILPRRNPHRYLIAFAVSVYFSTLPFYPGAGLSTSILPLYLHLFLKICDDRDEPIDWGLLLIIPFYTSFVFLYIFVLAFTFLYLLFRSLSNRLTTKKPWIAIILLTLLYIIVNYRLFEGMFLQGHFISHRTEFDVYFNQNAKHAYIYAIKFFLDGWMQHQRSLMMPFLLPIVLFGAILSFSGRRFSSTESLIIWLLFTLSFAVDFWQIILTNGYTLPLVATLSLWMIYRGGEQRIFGALLLFNIGLSLYVGLCFYDGLSFLKEWFPLLNSFNISRAAFIQPVLWSILLAYTFRQILQKLQFSEILIIAIVSYQLYYGIQVRRFDSHPSPGYLSFDQYYMPEVFEKIKRDIASPIEKVRFVSYGLEPAISLYNGLYTIDGYSTNYPLQYKHRFHDIQQICFDQMPGNERLFNGWGSKAYLLCVDSRPAHYRYYREKNVSKLPLVASTKGLCRLGADYLLSILPIKRFEKRGLEYIGHYRGSFYEVWLYHFNCEKIMQSDESDPKSRKYRWKKKTFRRKLSIPQK
jgi:hypothetical protein